MIYRNIIFEKSNIVKLGKILPTSGGSTIYPYHDSDDVRRETGWGEKESEVPKLQQDWANLGLKAGADVFYYTTPRHRRERTKLLQNRSAENKVSIGKVRSAAKANIVLSDSIATDAEIVYLSNQSDSIKLYSLGEEDVETSLYSYPISRYCGASAFSTNILSLFFERTPGLIDEIRLDVFYKSTATFLDGLHRDFRKEGGDIRIENVNKVITSIPKGVS